MHEDTTGPARPSGLRAVLVAVVVLVAGFHLVAVTLAALPPNRYSEAARPTTGYLGAYFAQNWRLFAPNPVSSDREVRFQGAYEEGGEVVATDWIDWTDVELDLVRHRLVGGRAGYVTNKAFGGLDARHAALGEDLQAVTDVVQPQDVPTWKDLSADLRAAAGDVPPVRIDSYLAHDRAFTQLATEVMEARTGRTMVAVRYATASQKVTPWEARHGSPEKREAARPTVKQRMNGWREPLRGDAAEQRVVADFDRRHR